MACGFFTCYFSVYVCNRAFNNKTKEKMSEQLTNAMRHYIIQMYSNLCEDGPFTGSKYTKAQLVFKLGICAEILTALIIEIDEEDKLSQTKQGEK